MTNKEQQFEQYWTERRAKRLVAEAEDLLANIADRETIRRSIMAKHGFDIGTRDQALNRSGPYADQANLDRIALFYMEHGVAVVDLPKETEQ